MAKRFPAMTGEERQMVTPRQMVTTRRWCPVQAHVQGWAKSVNYLGKRGLQVPILGQSPLSQHVTNAISYPLISSLSGRPSCSSLSSSVHSWLQNHALRGTYLLGLFFWSIPCCEDSRYQTSPPVPPPPPHNRHVPITLCLDSRTNIQEPLLQKRFSWINRIFFPVQMSPPLFPRYFGKYSKIIDYGN